MTQLRKTTLRHVASLPGAITAIAVDDRGVLVGLEDGQVGSLDLAGTYQPLLPATGTRIEALVRAAGNLVALDRAWSIRTPGGRVRVPVAPIPNYHVGGPTVPEARCAAFRSDGAAVAAAIYQDTALDDEIGVWELTGSLVSSLDMRIAARGTVRCDQIALAPGGEHVAAVLRDTSFGSNGDWLGGTLIRAAVWLASSGALLATRDVATVERPSEGSWALAFAGDDLVIGPVRWVRPLAPTPAPSGAEETAQWLQADVEAQVWDSRRRRVARVDRLADTWWLSWHSLDASGDDPLADGDPPLELDGPCRFLAASGDGGALFVALSNGRVYAVN